MTPLEFALFLLEKGASPEAISKQASLLSQQKGGNLLMWRHLALFQKNFYIMDQLCKARHRAPALWIEELVERSISGHKTPYPLQIAIITTLVTPLRQSIGSCFASACAIFVQFHHPDQMIQDLIELLTQGSLKRIDKDSILHYPLCPADNLLKAWEFTIASMSGNRGQILRWNFTHILGIHDQTPFSFGRVLYQKSCEMEHTLSENEKSAEREVEITQRELNLYESMARQSDFERAKRANIAADFKAAALNSALEKAHYVRQMIDFLPHLPQKLQEEIDSYLDLYFVELYDPSLLLPESENAGFTLHFKAKGSPLSWKKIEDNSSLAEALFQFLAEIEREIIEKERWRSLKPLIQEIFTSWRQLAQNPAFANHAKERLAAAHLASPLKTTVISAYSYISGGTFHSLLEVYFGKIFHEKKFEIAQPEEIVKKLVEFMKSIPPLQAKKAQEDPYFHFFLSMPEHAMLFCPSVQPFKSLWNEKKEKDPLLEENLMPLIFGDTNWEKNCLALFHEPGKKEFSLIIFAQGDKNFEKLPLRSVAGLWQLYLPF